MLADSYLTLSTTGQAIFTEKRSKFIAFACHVDTVEDAMSYVEAVKKKYFDARHVCWAYALGVDGETNRSNDDGEPSGSAGKPIWGSLRAKGITHAVVVVVRYFGGIKLGTGGLAVAYKTAAAQALEQAEVKTCVLMSDVSVFSPFPDLDVCLRKARNLGAQTKSQTYTADGCEIVFTIRQAMKSALREALKQCYTLRVKDSDLP